MEAISLTESQARIECERIVRRGELTFFEVGKALLRLRDERLYRNDYETFEDYCKAEFGWSASRARQHIQASIVAESVTNVTLPNEAVARELAKVDESKRAEVVERASSNGKLTAKSIRESAGVPSQDHGPAAEEVAPATNLPEPEPPKKDAEFANALGLTAEEVVNYFADEVRNLVAEAIKEGSLEQLERLARVTVIIHKQVQEAIKNKQL